MCKTRTMNQRIYYFGAQEGVQQLQFTHVAFSFNVDNRAGVLLKGWNYGQRASQLCYDTLANMLLWH